MKAFIARQPIFDRDKAIHAYELLHRNSEENYYNESTDGNTATLNVISEAKTTFGIKTIANGKPAFINFTRDLIERDFPLLLGVDEVVVEILENIVLDENLLEKLLLLKTRGYTLALDDYTGSDIYDTLLEYVDIVKVDFLALDHAGRVRVAKKLKKINVCMLAEKVETQEEFDEAVEQGYTLFQGYFFAKATMVSKSTASVIAGSCTRILRELNSGVPSYGRLAEYAKADVGLCYKVLNRANGIEFYRSNRVTNIREALVRMGFFEIRKLMSLLLLREMVAGENTELARMSYIRGVICERLANLMPDCKDISGDAFMTGMFSLLDIMMDDSFEVLLEDLCISEQVKSALLGEDNTILRRILNTVIAYEKGDWDNFSIDIEQDTLIDIYLSAIAEADKLV